MLITTPNQIEAWLYSQGGWVSSEHLCFRWDVSERELRKQLACVAISRHEGGYIHAFHATTAELEAYCGPKWAHGVAELKSVKQLRKNFRERRRPAVDVPATVQPSIL